MVNLPAGPHTIAWVYAKDGGVVDGQDAVAVDDISAGNGHLPDGRTGR